MNKQTTYKNVVGLRCLRNIKKQTNDLYLVHCGQQKCPPGYTYDHKIPNEHHLHFVLDGKGVLIVHNKVHHIKKDDIFIIPKGVPIQYFADSEDPWEYIWVTFDGTVASNYLSYAGLSDSNPVITSAIPTKVYLPLVQKILDANELTYANEIKRVGYLFEILGILIEAQSTLNRNKNQYDYSSDAYIDYAMQYISLNYDHIKVSDIAKYIGINRSYLTHIFKKNLNISPQKYLLNYRLKKAAELIRTTNMSIQDIAVKVGYENPLTFSKMFKQVYGVSPKHYRYQNS
ncbi:MAG TPA: AraC family transcriptional regulator [Epulopiscium sp.]|nr:AraC family transcriptional regulator [Candidatus Epulonipiscium sp.]